MNLPAILLAVATCAVFAPAAAFAAAEAASTTGPDPTSVLEWRLVGPFRAGWVTAAAGAGQGSDTFYFGAADGGVWKSDDTGHTWSPVFDGAGSASVGALGLWREARTTCLARLDTAMRKAGIEPIVIPPVEAIRLDGPTASREVP